jgi:hypothetical protein
MHSSGRRGEEWGFVSDVAHVSVWGRRHPVKPAGACLRFRAFGRRLGCHWASLLCCRLYRGMVLRIRPPFTENTKQPASSGRYTISDHASWCTDCRGQFSWSPDESSDATLDCPESYSIFVTLLAFHPSPAVFPSGSGQRSLTSYTITPQDLHLPPQPTPLPSAIFPGTLTPGIQLPNTLRS